MDENKRVDEETSKRIDEMNAILQSYMEEDRAFKEEIKHSIAVQHNACMQLLANIVETTYYACKNKKTLTMNEFKRIVNAFSIYHGEFDGNSYIAELYNEMMEWEKI